MSNKMGPPKFPEGFFDRLIHWPKFDFPRPEQDIPYPFRLGFGAPAGGGMEKIRNPIPGYSQLVSIEDEELFTEDIYQKALVGFDRATINSDYSRRFVVPVHFKIEIPEDQARCLVVALNTSISDFIDGSFSASAVDQPQAPIDYAQMIQDFRAALAKIESLPKPKLVIDRIDCHSIDELAKAFEKIGLEVVREFPQFPDSPMICNGIPVRASSAIPEGKAILWQLQKDGDGRFWDFSKAKMIILDLGLSDSPVSPTEEGGA